MQKPIIGITQGDTNGIGLEVIVKALAPEGITDLLTPVIFANRQLLIQTINSIKDLNLKFQQVSSAADAVSGRINLVNIGEKLAVNYGSPQPESGKAAFKSLKMACNALEEGSIDALVTAPISKEAIQGDEFHFPGHTEYLQERFGNGERKAQMILLNDEVRVALLTTHLPISKVSENVKKEMIVEAVKELNHTLSRDFACDRPKIAVLSLNPHCGDGGLLGNEEETEIRPAVNELLEEGILAFGPYAADGFFGAGEWKKFDAVLAMYHDQGLAPFKTIAGAMGVNYTAGLEVIRTSPDHGTAYDIAGQMIADPTSMREAIYKAIDILRTRRDYDAAAANPLTIAVQKVSNKPQ